MQVHGVKHVPWDAWPMYEGHLDVFWYDEESAETFGNNTT